MAIPLPPEIKDLGRYHRLGEFGPAYEVLRAERPLRQEDDWFMKILILETGEEVEYRASHIRHDPPADLVPH